MSSELVGVGIVSGASPSIAIGRAHLLAPFELKTRHYTIERKDGLHEGARLNNAFSLVRSEIDELASHVAPEAPGEVRAFLDLHRMILDDALLSDAPRDLVRTKLINAEWALTIQLEEVCREFDAIEDEYFRTRSQDVRQVVERVLKSLAGARPATATVPKKSETDEPLVLIAHDLAPTEMLELKERDDAALAGFVTELGGPTSHTAILARSLGLPAIVGAANARQLVSEGMWVIIDAEAGRLIVDPDNAELARYRELLKQQHEHATQLRKLKGRIARTTDGVPIDLMANIELPEDARDALDAGADGIGLFRSEFLFMNRDELPSEDEQFEAYASVARAMKGKPVVIRTLDIGADKVLNAVARDSLGMAHGKPTEESNPALGLRAIRYCLFYPELFLTQLRAILRASSVGTVRILVPMLAHVHEIDQAMAFVARAKEQLKERKQKFDARVPVGGMIEVPAAALSLSTFLKRLDFISIGTNDLIQYTLAIDRTDDTVAHLYDPLHPAVLGLVAQIIRGAHKAGKSVAVCGEMAGDVKLTRVLLGFGLRQFSMHPAHLLGIKQQVLRTDIEEVTQLAARMLKTDDPDKLQGLLEKMNAG
jgi:phosphotransferase system enzyme I (PtsI)